MPCFPERHYTVRLGDKFLSDKKSKFIKTPIKGMSDMLPSDMRLRESVLSRIKKSYAGYGFMQIETPAMEHIENLCSNQGGENEKLIFKVLKRGAALQRDLENGRYDEMADSGLRYDLTVPLARYYANNSEQLPSPFKALQIGSVWRADNPQKGRFRQFTQCDIDILGDESNIAEIELIAATSQMLLNLLSDIDISGLTVHLNDRRILRALCLSAGFSEEDIPSVLISLDKLDKVGIEGVRMELLENGYGKEQVENYLRIYEKSTGEEDIAESITSAVYGILDIEVIKSLQEIMRSVQAMIDPAVSIVFDPTLVRGMGYYTGPVFEVTLDGYNFSVAGGGRYDEMIGKFTGNNVPACGFSIGFERIITILKEKQTDSVKLGADSLVILVAKDITMEQKTEVFARAKKLRSEGRTVSVLPMKRNLNAQFKKLEEEGFTEFEKIYRKDSME